MTTLPGKLSTYPTDLDAIELFGCILGERPGTDRKPKNKFEAMARGIVNAGLNGNCWALRFVFERYGTNLGCRRSASLRNEARPLQSPGLGLTAGELADLNGMTDAIVEKHATACTSPMPM
jgi:hypothetical protein